ncbi:hypothetical protein S83_038968, partial [Arachis hypogaea]
RVKSSTKKYGENRKGSHSSSMIPFQAESETPYSPLAMLLTAIALPRRASSMPRQCIATDLSQSLMPLCLILNREMISVNNPSSDIACLKDPQCKIIPIKFEYFCFFY